MYDYPYEEIPVMKPRAWVQKLQLYALPCGCYNEDVFQGEVS